MSNTEAVTRHRRMKRALGICVAGGCNNPSKGWRCRKHQNRVNELRRKS